MSMKPRLLMGGMTANRGGKEAFMMNVFTALSDDFSFHFLADQDVAIGAEILSSGGTIHHITPRGRHPLAYLRDINAVIATGGFEAIWLNQTVVNSIEPLLVASSHKVPIRILHSHSSQNMGSPLTGLLHAAQRHVAPYVANRLFACSEPAAQWFYGKRQYTFIPNAIDADHFQFNPPQRLGVRRNLAIPASALVLSHVARMGPEKNHSFSLEVLSALRNRNIDAHLVLVGDGAGRKQLEELASREGIARFVHFVGMQPDVAPYLDASDVSVLPSTFEGLPFTVIEAQAAGLPVLVSDVVTREAAASSTVEFLPLSSGPDHWADRAVKAARKGRNPNPHPLRSTAFDLKNSRHFLLDAIYASDSSSATKLR